MRLTFADCVFDSGTREISRGGRTAPISPKALRLLEILVESRPDRVRIGTVEMTVRRYVGGVSTQSVRSR